MPETHEHHEQDQFTSSFDFQAQPHWGPDNTYYPPGFDPIAGTWIDPAYEQAYSQGYVWDAAIQNWAPIDPAQPDPAAAQHGAPSETKGDDKQPTSGSAEPAARADVSKVSLGSAENGPSVSFDGAMDLVEVKEESVTSSSSQGNAAARQIDEPIVPHVEAAFDSLPVVVPEVEQKAAPPVLEIEQTNAVSAGVSAGVLSASKAGSVGEAEVPRSESFLQWLGMPESMEQLDALKSEPTAPTFFWAAHEEPPFPTSKLGPAITRDPSSAVARKAVSSPGVAKAGVASAGVARPQTARGGVASATNTVANANVAKSLAVSEASKNPSIAESDGVDVDDIEIDEDAPSVVTSTPARPALQAVATNANDSLAQLVSSAGTAPDTDNEDLAPTTVASSLDPALFETAPRQEIEPDFETTFAPEALVAQAANKVKSAQVGEPHVAEHAKPEAPREKTAESASPFSPEQPAENQSIQPVAPARESRAKIAGEHRVIVHTVEGQVKRGTLHGGDLDGANISIEVLPGQPPDEIPTNRLKAIFFLMASGAKPRQPEGQKLRVTFNDERLITGFAPNYQPGDNGFFLFPADTRTNTARIYVYSAAVKSVAKD